MPIIRSKAKTLFFNNHEVSLKGIQGKAFKRATGLVK